jgi:catechol 2,3-dioxygenase-like lactoylglutathione lyase family enzyme
VTLAPAGFGPVIQTAYVVEDIAKTEDFFTAQFGVFGWTRLPDVEFGPETCEYRGAPADFAAHISLAYLGDMQLELIQPTHGQSIYADFLASSGPGLHHVCVEPRDFEQSLHDAQANGAAITQRGTMADGAMEFAYLESPELGIGCIELVRIGEDMKAFFEAIKAGGR